MIELVADQTSPSGDSHVSVLAIFSTKEKADAMLILVRKWGNEYDPFALFYVREHTPEMIPVDPIDLSQIVGK